MTILLVGAVLLFCSFRHSSFSDSGTDSSACNTDHWLLVPPLVRAIRIQRSRGAMSSTRTPIHRNASSDRRRSRSHRRFLPSSVPCVLRKTIRLHRSVTIAYRISSETTHRWSSQFGLIFFTLSADVDFRGSQRYSQQNLLRLGSEPRETLTIAPVSLLQIQGRIYDSRVCSS